MLVPLDRQRPQLLAEVGEAEREEGPRGDVAGRRQGTRASGREIVRGGDYGKKWPKAAAKIPDDLDVLLEFHDDPAEHWIHLRTTNPIESTFATVRLRQRVIKGPGT